MYKIVFVVAVFAFALQGAFSSPVETAVPAQQGNLKSDSNPIKGAVDVVNKATNDVAGADTPTTTTEAASTTAAPKSGASSTEMCLLLVQVSSLALVAKHMLL